MRIGVIINTNDAEEAWNAMRFAFTALLQGHSVKVFLMGRGVEIEEIKNEKFDVKKIIDDFVNNGGELIACSTCIKIRRKEGTFTLCPLGVMNDLVKLVEESDKIVSFG